MLISEETDKLLYDLHQKISDTRPSEKEMGQHACFIAGTLVHTDKGLVPINKIKVGDRVLSRDENNPDAENVYKRVVSTFKSAEKKRIIHQCYLTQEGYGYLFCTEDHPIWVDHLVDAVEDENGKLIPERTYNEWVPALYLSSDEEHVLRTVDNDYAVVQSFETVSKATSILGKNYIGLWDNRYGEYADEFITVTEDDYTIWERGYRMRSVDGVTRAVPEPSMLLPNEKVCHYMPGEGPDGYDETIENFEQDYYAYVYNIEVEDTHTYFVGAAGIWVHNCGGAAGRECITRQLSLQHIQTLLPAAKQYWLDAGTSSEVLDLAQFSVAYFQPSSKNACKMTKLGCADIETQVGEQLKNCAILELYEHYLELMPILTCHRESLGLVLYDTNGYLLLPDGREYHPDQETQDEITA